MKYNTSFFLKKIFFFLFLSFLLHPMTSIAQQKQYSVANIGFYNCENFYDTQDDPEISDEEYLPSSAKHYTPELYQDKVTHLAKVIGDMGKDISPDGIALLGVAEVENKHVLEDLVQHPTLARQHYSIVHYNSPDKRGVDVGLLYNPKYFKVLSSRPIELKLINDDGSRRYTRDVLYVAGVFDGDTIHVLVNHWPSRVGGEKASQPGRAAAAMISKTIVDSLMAINPFTKVVIMGDLNDDPVSPSVTEVLQAKGKKDKVKAGGLYNTMYDFYKAGIGTLAHDDAWSLFDQIIISYGWLHPHGKQYQFYKARVFNENYLIQTSGSFKGYPLRTFVGDTYMGGYSDHFPTYVSFVKEK
jgi:endonuclease/exonuclease/phosphatase family metal-dependent hydrolase